MYILKRKRVGRGAIAVLTVSVLAVVETVVIGTNTGNCLPCRHCCNWVLLLCMVLTGQLPQFAIVSTHRERASRKKIATPVLKRW